MALPGQLKMYMLLRQCAHMRLLRMASVNFATSLPTRSGDILGTRLTCIFHLSVDSIVQREYVQTRHDSKTISLALC